MVLSSKHFENRIFVLERTFAPHCGTTTSQFLLRCPLLNDFSYWAPDAMTALGPVCRPNYDPESNPAKWSKFVTYLHTLVEELAHLYQPDLFWYLFTRIVAV